VKTPSRPFPHSASFIWGLSPNWSKCPRSGRLRSGDGGRQGFFRTILLSEFLNAETNLKISIVRSTKRIAVIISRLVHFLIRNTKVLVEVVVTCEAVLLLQTRSYLIYLFISAIFCFPRETR
jgi:hypothetical protein